MSGQVVIVGAGPAGVRAAETLVAAGLRPTVIDEAPASGGQIYRRPPAGAGFVRPARRLYGFEAGRAVRLHGAFDALTDRIDYRPETLAWDIEEGAVHIVTDNRTARLPFDGLILATGAMDRVVPFPGWTKPGVFTLGGAQIALKYQGCAIGRRTLFLGTGPLLYLVAWQYATAGARVEAVLDTARLGDKLGAAAGLLAGGSIFAKGLFYLGRLRTLGIPVESGVTPLAAAGDDAVAGLTYLDAAGRRRERACDSIGFGFGLTPETQLAELAGCRFRFDPRQRQWLPETDPDGRALGLAGVYLAGDGAGIAGAGAAELGGERTALALLRDSGRAVPGRRLQALERRQRRLRRFARALQSAFPFPERLAAAMPDETILCRCEAVTAGTLRSAARDAGADELNRAKAFTRVGMGRCQGRVCGPAAAAVLAAALATDLAAVGRLRGQPPVKPLPAAALAAGGR